MNLNECSRQMLECGSDGYIASVTNWHELLCISAPDPTCGTVHVTGPFPWRRDALLAGAQGRGQYGGKVTFGIEFLPDGNGELHLEGCMARGLYNHR